MRVYSQFPRAVNNHIHSRRIIKSEILIACLLVFCRCSVFNRDFQFTPRKFVDVYSTLFHFGNMP